MVVLFLSLVTFSQPGKQKPSAAKPKPAASKTKPAPTKPKPAAAKAKETSKSKPTAAKPKDTPKPKPSPAKKPAEKAEWDKASTDEDPISRVSLLRQFISTFPKSSKLGQATALIVTAEAGLGNEKLVSGDIPAAFQYFKAAASDAPKPLPNELFTETLSKFPANLFFRGGRDEGLEIAKLIEPKIDGSASQQLELAAFYMSVEDGSAAKRLAEAAVRLEPNSPAAYQVLGLANRIDFQLEESAAAFARALELEPGSLTARRGLAEMKRSLGRSDEAAELYREILAEDAANYAAQTGLILALFDGGKRTEAESEMAKALEANPGNVILLGSAGYWYAAHNEPDQAIMYARKAVEVDPRFIWSHIALARGLLIKKEPVEAEKTLLAARRYGNFPTLEYEIATIRLALGFYREAAEELAKNFAVADGRLRTNLGGRVARESKDLIEVVGYERRASIFAPTAADSRENAARLTALLEMTTLLSAQQGDPAAIGKAVDDFVRGNDKMRVHRQLYAAARLLERKIALPKVLELTKAAPADVEAGLDVPNASIAVMANELYEGRALAALRGQYVNVPDVARLTLSQILRGQIEQFSGWASFQLNDTNQAVIRLKRAINVLPPDSAWWRTSSWQLGTALASSGKDAEALDIYIKSYKSSGPNIINYGIIETLFAKVHGNTNELERWIGPKPVQIIPDEVVAQNAEPTPEPAPAATAAPVEIVKEPSRDEIPQVASAKIEATPSPTLEAVPDPTPAIPESTRPEPSPTIEATLSQTPRAKEPEKAAEIPASVPIALPGSAASPAPEEIRTAAPVPSPDRDTIVDDPKPAEEKPRDTINDEVAKKTAKDLFPPVVITIPAPQGAKPAPPKTEPSPTPASAKISEQPAPDSQPTPAASPDPKPGEALPSDSRPRLVEAKPEIKPCTFTLSEENINLQAGGGDLAVIVGLVDDGDLTGLAAVSSSPADVAVRRETIPGVTARALFVIRPTSSKTGIYQVRFELPCGKKDLLVKVK